MSKEISIADLKIDQKIDSVAFALKELEQKMSRVGKPYYNVLLGDKTGELRGKVWTENLLNCNKDASVGSIVLVSGTIQEFAGKPQIIIDSLETAIGMAPEEFLPVTSRDRTDMKEELEARMSKIQNPNLKALVDKFWLDENNRDKFINFPAGEYVHHGYVGGLLEHVWEMYRLSLPFFEIYANLDSDLFFTGLLFHDIGKLEELDIVGAAIIRTTPGRLVAHIGQGLIFVDRLVQEIPDFPTGLRDKLYHMILSHQGALEYGSPILPQTLESLILSFVDANSADMNQATKQIEKDIDTGEDFSGYHKWLGRSFYMKDRIST